MKPYFLPFCFLVIFFSCKNRNFNPKSSAKESAKHTEESQKPELSTLFNGPFVDKQGTQYVEVKSPNIVVFHYTKQSVLAGSTWEYIQKESDSAGIFLNSLISDVANKKLSESAALLKLEQKGGGNVAGPGLYLAPDAFVSREYGDTLVMSCLSVGTKLALSRLTEAGNLAMIRNYGGVIYDWYKGKALVVRDSKVLQSQSSFALKIYDSTPVEGSLDKKIPAKKNPYSDSTFIKMAPHLIQNACLPIQEIVKNISDAKFDPMLQMNGEAILAAKEALAFQKALKPHLADYLKVWPSEIIFNSDDGQGGTISETIQFGKPNEMRIARCLYDMWKPSNQNIFFPTPVEDGMCPYADALHPAIKSLKTFDSKLIPKPNPEGFTSLEIHPSHKFMDSFKSNLASISNENLEFKEILKAVGYEELIFAYNNGPDHKSYAKKNSQLWGINQRISHSNFERAGEWRDVTPVLK